MQLLVHIMYLNQISVQAIASKNLYMGAGSTCDTALTAFRGTLEIEYSVF